MESRDMENSPLIGFIGQGWIGKNYADSFEERGFAVVRYALEPEYAGNKDRIRECDIVFIAVPTPTTMEGFDASAVDTVLSLLAPGTIAVVKSTLLPGTTQRLQSAHPNLVLFHSPEFLSEATAAHDARHPFANIVGMAEDTEQHRKAAEKIHSVLQPAPASFTCGSTEAEIMKYSHNGSGFTQVVFFNLVYDLAVSCGADWSAIEQMIAADPMISTRYAKPLHRSGRGAGGNCFVKDFAALSSLYAQQCPKDVEGQALLEAMERKNLGLLAASGKDQHIVAGVYGSKGKP